MRGRSYTPSPPRGGYGRRGRSPSPRGRYGGGGGSGGRDGGGGRGRDRDGPTSLLVRNLRHDCRPDDLRRPFGQFGAVKDIYLPRDYYTGDPRGFGFVQFVNPEDAGEAKYQMDGQMFQGRTLTVVFAEENRKKPTEMRTRDRGGSGRGRGYDRRRSPPPYSRSSRYSRSPPPRSARSRSRSQEYYSPSPKRRQYSRSLTPQDKKHGRERSYSQSPAYNNSRSRSRSPIQNRGPSRSRSPAHDEKPIEPEMNGSPSQ